MNDTITKAEEIKELYDKLKAKGKFVEALAKQLKMSKKYMINYWFPSCDITEVHQDTTLKLLKETIKNQENEKSN